MQQGAMRGLSREVKVCHIANCTKADPAYGAGARAAIASLED